MKASQHGRTVLTVVLEVVGDRNGVPGGWHCQGCKEELELHQPDSANPDRLLGTCPGCGRWYLIDGLANDARSVLAHLPDQVAMRRVLDGHQTVIVEPWLPDGIPPLKA